MAICARKSPPINLNKLKFFGKKLSSVLTDFDQHFEYSWFLRPNSTYPQDHSLSLGHRFSRWWLCLRARTAFSSCRFYLRAGLTCWRCQLASLYLTPPKYHQNFNCFAETLFMKSQAQYVIFSLFPMSKFLVLFVIHFKWFFLVTQQPANFKLKVYIFQLTIKLSFLKQAKFCALTPDYHYVYKSGKSRLKKSNQAQDKKNKSIMNLTLSLKI